MTISQELFDETILENEECFDLSPDEALKETIDQFCQQLGQNVPRELLVVADNVGGIVPSPTSVVGNDNNTDNEDNMTMTVSLLQSIPAAMAHLSLTHPSTPHGQAERENRNQFRKYLSLLDDCVGNDGVVTLPPLLSSSMVTTANNATSEEDDTTAAATTTNNNDNDKIFEALSQLSIKLQPSNNTTTTTTTKNDPLPYLIIFQQSSSIYTLMSFLSILQPTTTNDTTTQHQHQLQTTTTTTTTEAEEMYKLQILQKVITTLISILSSSSTKENSQCITIRNQLRDVFMVALERYVVNLLFHFGIVTSSSSPATTTASAATTSTTTSLVDGENMTATKQQLQQTILLDLLKLSIHGVKGCEGGKVAFVQSSLTAAAAANSSSGTMMTSLCNTKRRGGVQVLFMILSNAVMQFCSSNNANNSINANNDSSNANNNDSNNNNDEESKMNMMITEATCHLLSTLCRYDDFRTPSSGGAATATAAAAAGVSTSSAHDHAMEFHRVNMESLLMKIAAGVLNDLLDEEGGRGGGGDCHGSTSSSSGSSNGSSYGNDNKDNGGDGDSDEKDILVKKELLAAAVLTALRVLAVNDEIIQTMVALGVLPIVTKALRLSVTTATNVSTTTTTTHDNESSCSNGNSHTRSNLLRKHRLAAASLGLLRNLCGNDEIKTNLCLGSTDHQSSTIITSISSTPSALPHLLRAMELYPTISPIQEHACGTLAAMALRRPSNARAIMDANGHKFIIMAMKRHTENVSVQRQGALAIRNIVSRLMRDLENSGDKNAVSSGNSTTATEKEEDARSDIRDRFAELGVEDVLRNIAGRHQGSVDEAYAALRDLGYSVTLTKINAEDLLQEGNLNNVAVVGSRTRMFGEKHNSNFRPVYEQSAGLDNAVDEAVSNFGM